MLAWDCLISNSWLTHTFTSNVKSYREYGKKPGNRHLFQTWVTSTIILSWKRFGLWWIYLHQLCMKAKLDHIHPISLSGCIYFSFPTWCNWEFLPLRSKYIIDMPFTNYDKMGNGTVSFRTILAILFVQFFAKEIVDFKTAWKWWHQGNITTAYPFHSWIKIMTWYYIRDLLFKALIP